MSAPTVVKIIENVIVLEVGNLLQGWPAYVINFTPTDAKPHKIILHLRDAPTKYRQVIYNDKDPGEYMKMISNKDAQVCVVPKDSASDEPASEGLAILDASETSSEGEESSESEDDKKNRTVIDAIPIMLSGIREERKWPPHWPRGTAGAFREIEEDDSVAGYRVKAEEDGGSVEAACGTATKDGGF